METYKLEIKKYGEKRVAAQISDRVTITIANICYDGKFYYLANQYKGFSMIRQFGCLGKKAVDKFNSEDKQTWEKVFMFKTKKSAEKLIDKWILEAKNGCTKKALN